MPDILYILLTAIVALGVGVFIGRSMLQKVYKQQEEDARQRAKTIIREAEANAESIKKDRILEAKEKFLKLKEEFDEEMNKKKNIILQNEAKVKQREQQATKQYEQAKRLETDLEKEKEALTTQLDKERANMSSQLDKEKVNLSTQLEQLIKR